jgi:hypothetical protein
MRTLLVAVAVLGVLGFANGFGQAAEGETNLRFGLAYVGGTGDYEETTVDVTDVPAGTLEQTGVLTAEPDTGVGAWVEWGYEFTDVIELTASLGWSEIDVDLLDRESIEVFDGTGMLIDTAQGELRPGADLTMIPLLFGVSFHVYRSDFLDFYVAPQVGYIFFGDIDAEEASLSFSGEGWSADAVFQDVDLDDSVAYGGLVGADFPFGGGDWMISARLRYLLSSPDFTDPAGGPDEIDIDPWFAEVGVAYSFGY